MPGICRNHFFALNWPEVGYENVSSQMTILGINSIILRSFLLHRGVIEWAFLVCSNKLDLKINCLEYVSNSLLLSVVSLFMQYDSGRCID